MSKQILRYWKVLACLLVLVFAAQHINSSWSLYQSHMAAKLVGARGEAIQVRHQLRRFQKLSGKNPNTREAEFHNILKTNGIQYIHMVHPFAMDNVWGKPLSTIKQRCSRQNTYGPVALTSTRFLVLEPAVYKADLDPRLHKGPQPPMSQWEPIHQQKKPAKPNQFNDPYFWWKHHVRKWGPPRTKRPSTLRPNGDLCDEQSYPPSFGSLRTPPYIAYEFEPTETLALIAEAKANFYKTIAQTSLLILMGLIIALLINRRERQKQRLRDQRLTAKLGKMTALVSHELRNPLSASIGQAELLAEQIDTFLADDLNKRERVHTVIDELSHIEQLSDLLLDSIKNHDTSDGDPS